MGFVTSVTAAPWRISKNACSTERQTDGHAGTGGSTMTNRSTRLIGSTLGIVTGGTLAAIGVIHVIQLSLLRLF